MDSVISYQYPGAESNCYQKFRKLLFYPLNYRGIVNAEGGATLRRSLRFLPVAIAQNLTWPAVCKVNSKFRFSQYPPRYALGRALLKDGCG